MNELDFTQPGGFPLDQDVLAFLQAQSKLAGQTSAFGGSLSIISGCVEAGGNVTDGFIAINGEILPFVGTAVDLKVVIVETVNNLTYEDGVDRAAEKIRYATFGDDGVTNYLWANFKRNTSEGILARLERLERVAAPFLSADGGGMVLFNKAAMYIPAGWQEVVDWRGRIPVGLNVDDIDFNTIGKTGGAKTHKLTKNEQGAFEAQSTSTGADGTARAYTQNIRLRAKGDASWTELTANTGNYTSPVKTINLGEAQDAHSILNPYRTVYFIELIDKS
ncbi:MAG: hypothetical protein IE931_03290 [Sphingobacteriales bacterium]|nr:hypothetical protein [Sphingobacteriales bacterium]